MTPTQPAHPYFFGYGSLVNRDTHIYSPAQTATAQGWRRIWRHTTAHDFAILTAVPSPGTAIDGLIAPVPNADWAALDAREIAYDRLIATPDITHSQPQPFDIAIYSIPEAKHPVAPTPTPILLSYLDVVVQGYLREFGPAGAHRFFDTTDGWSAPILNDRPAPLYPRAQRLTPDETAFVDTRLAQLNAQILAT
ncbi:gamma-glutamylcyclotransferase family protein [Pseudooceanicola spongiae]|uniref:Gamma-glutamylcyclotransferase n=1 Tax=Pseudooceanicola spongiae TaxID=2613965 RepID=A0A7L9WP06_9RHOB|nr:gamma-glutamylcyclotransferase family protein [Pseudooceanicola spongiae]QOL81564.1 gamma-glutamylcyclotransferase [Pseudooceanicola spongiae]